jgi:protein-disulfide isomerase
MLCRCNAVQYIVLNKGVFMDKKFILVLLVIVGLFGGYLVANKKSTDINTATTVSATNFVRGSKDAKVQIVEYGDFQCPACGGFYPILQQIEAKYGDKIGVTFKNFPLDAIHPNARAAHRAAYAAGLQGKFYEMHDLLYQSQNGWKSSTNMKSVVDSFATQLSLDMVKYEADFANPTTNAAINADIKEGQSKKVNSTPTFFINSVQVDNNDISTVDLFSAKIDAILGVSETPVTTQTETPVQAIEPVTE